MPRHKKLLLEAFKPYFKEAGFTKKSATWHRANDECIQVFNVQTSDWSEQYLFNAGIYLKSLGSEIHPVEYKCHIRTRIPARNHHDTETHRKIHEISDFSEKPEIEESQVLELASLVFPLALDWLERFSTLGNIKRELDLTDRPNFMVQGEVWKLLGILKK
jgi:hypothetical protein